MAGRFLVMILCLVGMAVQARMLADAGKSDYVIVLAPGAIPAEKSAAFELQEFLREISGVELPVVAESTGPAIRVGQSPEAARALGIADWGALKPDEIILKAVGDDLYLAGDRPRGTLYAVYELLEKEFGVRFWTASATRVPKAEMLKLPCPDIRFAPPFEVRSAGYELLFRDPRFAVRLRNNGHGFANPPELGGDVQLLGGVHTFSENMPLIRSDRCFPVHPEWFAERDGKRIAASQLCLTNRELRRELAAQVLERLRRHPGTRYVSVSQNDNHWYCRCAACMEFVKRNGNQADLLIDAVNEVAAAVKKEFPEVYVETLAYYYTRTPPERIRAADNVVVRYCTIEADAFHPLTGKSNQALLKDLAGWRRMAPQLMVWHYVTDFRKYYQPHPNWRVIGPDLRTFRECGVVSIYEQGPWNGGGAAADLGELRAWLVSKLLWNPDQDAGALIDEFLAGYYGPAAEAVRGYIDLMNAAADRHPEVKTDCYAASTEAWLDIGTLTEAWRKLEAAYERFREDPVYGPRLAIAAVPAGCALVERHDRPAGIDTVKLAPELARRMKEAGVTRMREGGTSPEEWAAEQVRRNSISGRDGSRPAVAGDGPFRAWSIGRIFPLNALGTELFWEEDGASLVGKAVRMPNTHDRWHVMGKMPVSGRFDLYADVRCDSSAPTGNAVRIGTYAWVEKKEFFRDIPASEIAGKRYRTVKVGTVELTSDVSIFIAPVVNPAVSSIWIDRIILIPKGAGK